MRERGGLSRKKDGEDGAHHGGDAVHFARRGLCAWLPARGVGSSAPPPLPPLPLLPPPPSSAPRPALQFVLSEFKWQQEVAQTAWFDTEGAASVRARLGVSAGADPPPGLHAKLLAAHGPTVMDAIEWEDLPVAEFDACACGHPFSRASWARELAAAIGEGPAAALSKTCPHGGCKERVRPRMWRAYLPLELWQKYLREMLRSFVGDAPGKLLSVCPGACGLVVIARTAAHGRVQCAAGHAFCFKCGAAPHDPVTCAVFREWEGRESDPTADDAWLAAFTKPCPNCKTAIQKGEGCNHMTCKKEARGCGFEFCWICLVKWSSHNGSHYTCA